MSEHQVLINDASQGGKGFTDKFVESQIIDKVKAKTRVDLLHQTGISQSPILLTMLKSKSEIAFEGQAVGNKQGIAFKRFIPRGLGAKKEGWNEGGLAGPISVVLPLC